MPRATVRVERIEVKDPVNEDEYRFVSIDSDGDLYLQDGAGDDATSILIRKRMIAPVIKALRLAGRA